jgi:hypothetical protein
MRANNNASLFCLPLLTGLAIGVTISVTTSTQDYVSSFTVAARVFNLTSQWALAARDARYVIPLVIILCGVAAAIAPHFGSLLRNQPGLLIVFGSGAMIFLGFAVSGWPGDGFPTQTLDARHSRSVVGCTPM